MRTVLILGVTALVLLAPPVVTSEPSKSTIYTVTSTYEIKNLGLGAAEDVEATVHPFRDWSGWTSQRILSTQILPNAGDIENEVGENEVAKATVPLGTISPGEGKTITVVQAIEVGAIDMRIDPDEVGATIPPEFIEFTEPVDGLWESDDPGIASKAHELTDNEPNLYFKVERIIEFIENYLTYRVQTEEHGALWAWRHREGDCTEYTNLFIAFCRAVGIPTKFVVAYGYRDEHAPEMQKMAHAFALVYLPNIGWVPVDLTWPAGIASYGELDYFHLSFSVSGYTVPPDVSKIGIIYSYIGPRPRWDIRHTGSAIVREVGIDFSMETGPMRNRILPLSIAVKNSGRQGVENLKVEVLGDPRYFDGLPESKDIDSLPPGGTQTIDFSVHTTEDAVGMLRLAARVTYDVEYAGAARTFLAEEELQVTIPEPQVPIPEPPPAEPPIEMMPILLTIAALSAVVIALIIRRR